MMTNATNVNDKKGKDQMSDKDILDFYNLATGRLLTGLEVSTQAYEFNISKLYTPFKTSHQYSFHQIKYFSILERSWKRSIGIELENLDVLFQYDQMFRECRNWIGVWSKVNILQTFFPID